MKYPSSGCFLKPIWGTVGGVDLILLGKIFFVKCVAKHEKIRWSLYKDIHDFVTVIHDWNDGLVKKCRDVPMTYSRDVSFLPTTKEEARSLHNEDNYHFLMACWFWFVIGVWVGAGIGVILMAIIISGSNGE